MKIIKIAKSDWQNSVIDVLNKLNIKNERENDGLIKVERDSIIRALNKEESESYRGLIQLLNKQFNSRFDYVLKNDDWLWMDKII